MKPTLTKTDKGDRHRMAVNFTIFNQIQQLVRKKDAQPSIHIWGRGWSVSWTVTCLHQKCDSLHGTTALQADRRAGAAWWGCYRCGEGRASCDPLTFWLQSTGNTIVQKTGHWYFCCLWIIILVNMQFPQFCPHAKLILK